MKYYKSKFWKMMNSDDPEERDKGDREWVELAKQYSSYFETVKSKLPKGFIKIFDKHDWFHDFSINNINIENTGKCLSTIELYISYGAIAYKVTLKGVKRTIVNIPTTQNWLYGMLTWGYSEFELNENGIWIIRILCDFDCEIEIAFKRISITKI